VAVGAELVSAVQALEVCPARRIYWTAMAGVWAALVGASAALPQGDPDTGRVFAYDRGLPLDVQQVDSTVVAGVIVRDISYASPKGGRVPAYLVVPERSGRRAGIVFVHWGQGNRSEFLAEAVALAPRGVESLLIDAPFNRIDDPNRGQPGPGAERAGYVQLVVDIRRGIDLLRGDRQVDSARIGYVGHSLGATWGGVVAGLDHRVKALVLMGGLPTLTDSDFPDPLIRRDIAARPAAERAAFEQVMGPINPVHFVIHSAPSHLLFQWARADRYISEGAAGRYFAAAGGPKMERWYYSSHEFNDPQALTDRDQFLATQLGLSAP
jgi:dienelactone hydrolase